MNNILQNYYDARFEHDKQLELLDEETCRIIKVITKVFNTKNYWWSFKYYDNADDDAPLPQNTRDNIFPVYIADVYCDSGKWDYCEGFPVKFFDMTDEEIKNCIKKEIEHAKIKKTQEKEKKSLVLEEKNKKQHELFNSIKAKLTPSEIKALKALKL